MKRTTTRGARALALVGMLVVLFVIGLNGAGDLLASSDGGIFGLR